MSIEEAVARIRADLTLYLHQVKGIDAEDPFVQDIEAINILLTAYAAQAADSKRLDYLDQHHLNVRYDPGDEDHWDGWHCMTEEYNRVEEGRVEYRSLRDAIDAAVSGTETTAP